MTVNKIDLTQKQLDKAVAIDEEEKELGLETEIIYGSIYCSGEYGRGEDTGENKTIAFGDSRSFDCLL